MKIYISGKITGYELSEAEAKFKKSANYLLKKGLIPINPFDLSSGSTFKTFVGSKTWKDYMIDDINALFDCDAIFMQQDWGQSKGARIEYAIARELGLQIYHEGSF